MNSVTYSTLIRVEFDDLDAGGVVHHPNYLKLCERARNLWLEQFGADFVTLKTQDIALAVRSIGAEYLRPVTMGSARVEIKLIKLGKRSFTLEHKVFGLEGPFANPEKENFRADITFVTANYSSARSCALPASVLSALSAG